MQLERMAKTGEATEDELKQVCNRLTLEKLDPKKCYLRPRKCRLLKQWDDGERRAMKDLSDNSDYSTSPIPPPPLSIGAAVWTYLTSLVSVPPAPPSGTAHMPASHTFRGPSLHSAASVPPAPPSGTARVPASHTFRGPSLHSAASVPPAPPSGTAHVPASHTFRGPSLHSAASVPPAPPSGTAHVPVSHTFRGPSLHSAASVPPAPPSGTAHVPASHTFRGPSLHSAASVPPAPPTGIGPAGSSDSAIHALKIGKGTLSESTPLSGPKESGIGKGGSKGSSKRCSTKNTAKSGTLSEGTIYPICQSCCMA